MVNGGDSFKRPGSVPFNWEIRPGVPKTRNHQPDDDPTLLLQPPKKLPPLRLKPLPPSSSSSSSSSISRPVSPFDPPPSFKLKPSPDSESHSSRPPTPYFRSSSPRARLDFGDALPRCFPKSLFGMKKSKSGFFKKTGQESSSPTSESENFYESETTFTPSEDSSQGSVSSSTRWSSPKSSFSSISLRGSPLRRNKSDLSSYERKENPL